MNEAAPASKSRVVLLSVAYLALCLVFALFGYMLSFTAQPGGITQTNAFVAPFLGPWAQTLPPNPHPVSTWTAEYNLFARCLSVALGLSLVGSYLAPRRWLRTLSAGMAFFALVPWLFVGLMKVVQQLH
ncbi:MAG: hypothetical protein ACYTAS_22125 [Planctomycetota bacterium]|jgi:hypothetical protein